MKFRINPFLLGAVFSILLFSSPATAHKVTFFSYVDNGRVYIEAFFPDGRPVIKGGIEIFDSKGQQLLKGSTDEEGYFSFPITIKDDLTIVIKASMGHKTKSTLKKNELE